MVPYIMAKITPTPAPEPANLAGVEPITVPITSFFPTRVLVNVEPESDLVGLMFVGDHLAVSVTIPRETAKFVAGKMVGGIEIASQLPQ